MNVNRRTKAGIVNPRESHQAQFYMTSAGQKNTYAYQKLIETPESNTLSPAALETLAIIAYNQPITRIEIDEMRGVNNVHMIRKLVKEVGKSTMPGRPNLYGTTSEFLDYFGLSSIKELPLIVKEEEPLENDTELFTSIYKEGE